MSTFDNLVNDVLRTLQGYGLAQHRASHLTGSVSSSALTIPVSDGSSFGQGVAEIGNETVFIETVSGNDLIISPDGRGYYGTTAAAYTANQRIEFQPTWAKADVAAAINAAIVSTFPTLFGVAQTTFTYNPSINTYSLPADCERVLSVVTDTYGPSLENLQITRYSTNLVVNTADFATTNSITLEQAGWPGRDITVTYAKQPSELTWGQAFTASGLRETAKTAIKYKAISDLLAFVDPARVQVDTAQADEYDPSRSGLGQASRISTQLYQRYLLEVEQERKRLRATTPVAVKVRTR